MFRYLILNSTEAVRHNFFSPGNPIFSPLFRADAKNFSRIYCFVGTFTCLKMNWNKAVALEWNEHLPRLQVHPGPLWHHKHPISRGRSSLVWAALTWLNSRKRRLSTKDCVSCQQTPHSKSSLTCESKPRTLMLQRDSGINYYATMLPNVEQNRRIVVTTLLTHCTPVNVHLISWI